MPNQICFRNGWTLVCSVLHDEKHPLAGAHMHAHTHIYGVLLSGNVPRTRALARCDCKPALAVLRVLRKHRDVPHNCCLPCACLLYFPFVSWSGNHRLIPVRSCKCLHPLDQTQKNSSHWLQCIYILRPLQGGAHLCIHSHMSKQRY